jgi:hypothetical protein
MRLEPMLEGKAIERATGPSYSINEVIQAVRDCGRRPRTLTDNHRLFGLAAAQGVWGSQPRKAAVSVR